MTVTDSKLETYIANLTEDTTPDKTNDLLMSYDASAAGMKKVKMANIGGTGDASGPASSTDNAIARFDSTSGKVLQNSLATVDDSGTVNIPTGQTYNINGSAHTHAASLTNSAAFCTGDVALNNTSSWFDGATLSLAAGTWLLIGGASLASGNVSATVFVLRLWDGSTIYAEVNAGTIGSYAYCGGSITALVTLGTTTTVKFSANANQTTGVMKATIAQQGTTNKGTWLNAVKIA